MRRYYQSLLLLGLITCFVPVFGQTDTTETEEEDYSIYDNLEFADEGAKRFASVKIKGLSPQKLISIGYDFQGAHDLETEAFGGFNALNTRVNSVSGMRFEANIPVISKNSLIVQVGGRYWESNYEFDNEDEINNPLAATLAKNGLRTSGLSTTIYKPLDEYSFLLVRASADMNGDYGSDLQGMEYMKYSIAALWGKRPSDYKQWAIGLSRTYRAGELNYIPVLLYNWTSPTSKWGTEILFPARGHLRYTLNSRNMLMFGFELEGNSFRIGNQKTELNEPFNDLEIRRSELRFRFVYERQLTGFIWLSAQAGYRYNYSFNVDRLADGEDFYRGFFGDEDFIMENELTNPMYFNISINLVSP